MPPRENIINFGAGPAMLPTPVLQQASQDLLNYNDAGMSLAEMSHRSSTANTIIASANGHLRDLLAIPDTHEIMWQQGGGTAQFSMVVYNLVAAYVARGGDPKHMTADYLVTGGWSKKAYDEAVRLGITDVNLVINTKKEGGPGKFGGIPASGEFKWSKGAVYAYYCDNETVDGIEFPGTLEGVPEGVPIVCDMSSNILSRKVDVSKFAVIYAGAQKNVGITGISIIIVRKDILTRADAKTLHEHNIPPVPIVFDYVITLQNNSLYNTLPIFTLHIADLVFAHLLSNGGIEGQSARNDKKSQLVYGVLDQAAKDGKVMLLNEVGCRSRMNIPFKFMGRKDVDAAFVKEAEGQGMMQLKGHRSLGGIRVSLYNAVTVEQTERLVEFIKGFLAKL